MAPIPAAVLAAIIGAGGSLAGGIAQAGSIAAQNAYNSPAAQLARLREAGLPMAAFTSQGTGNQSGLPGTHDMGASQISNYIATRTALKQIDLIDAQTQKMRAEAEESIGRLNWLKEVDTSKFLDNNLSNQTRQLNYARDLQQWEESMKRNEQLLSDMEYMYQEGLYTDNKKRELFDAGLDVILQNLKNSKLAEERGIFALATEKQMAIAKQKVYQMLEKNVGTLGQILYLIFMGGASPSNFKF